MRLRFFLVALFLWIGTFFSLSAQRDNLQKDSIQKVQNPKHLHAFVALAPLGYKGDLGNPYHKWDRALWLGIQKRKAGKRLQTQAQIGIGRISGSDAFFRPDLPDSSGLNPNRSFQTSLLALQIGGQYVFLETEQLRLSAGLGLGLLRFSPKDEAGNLLVEQNGTRFFTEDYANTTLYLPIEMNLQYHFKNRMAFGFSAGFLNPFTKYLDNIALLGNDKNDNILKMAFSFFVPLNHSDH
ncbi:hypothetical protein [Hugenholtzia roseola]|uniref:hypothetical protein n=1 Tax=Hugenholtzia roseola TaxID=1002 RepID=UPI000419FBDE|nr:hypothetical protein [Hugenholtzia roseola]